jgi:hypothetical protein
MPGVRHRLFAAFSVASLVLCLAMCVIWARSYFRSDDLKYESRVSVDDTSRQWQCASYFGWILLQTHFFEWKNTTPGNLEIGWNFVDIGDEGHEMRKAHLKHERLDGVFKLIWWHSIHRSPGDAATQYGILISDLYITLALAISPLFWFLKSGRRRLRQAARRCQICGYDLRATPDRCPECGTTPSQTE